MKAKPLNFLVCAFLLLTVTSFSQAPHSSKAAAKSTGQSAGKSSAGVIQDYRQIKAPPLPPFKPQQPKRIQLKNGMVIFLQEDHELPLIDGYVLIRGGSRDVPAEKTGLTAIYSDVWRT